eukprot:jgi/Mesen1/10376/ME000081S09766
MHCGADEEGANEVEQESGAAADKCPRHELPCGGGGPSEQVSQPYSRPSQKGRRVVASQRWGLSSKEKASSAAAVTGVASPVQRRLSLVLQETQLTPPGSPQGRGSPALTAAACAPPTATPGRSPAGLVLVMDEVGEGEEEEREEEEEEGEAVMQMPLMRGEAHRSAMEEGSRPPGLSVARALQAPPMQLLHPVADTCPAGVPEACLLAMPDTCPLGMPDTCDASTQDRERWWRPWCPPPRPAEEAQLAHTHSATRIRIPGVAGGHLRAPALLPAVEGGEGLSLESAPSAATGTGGKGEGTCSSAGQSAMGVGTGMAMAASTGTAATAETEEYFFPVPSSIRQEVEEGAALAEAEVVLLGRRHLAVGGAGWSRRGAAAAGSQTAETGTAAAAAAYSGGGEGGGATAAAWSGSEVAPAGHGHHKGGDGAAECWGRETLGES